MSAFAVDQASGELIRDAAGRLTRVDGAEEIVQALALRWQLVQGELTLDDPSAGLPIFELAQKGTPEQRIVQLLAEQGARVPGVVALDIDDPTLDHDTRVMTVTFRGEASVADLRQRVALEGQATIPIG